MNYFIISFLVKKKTLKLRTYLLGFKKLCIVNKMSQIHRINLIIKIKISKFPKNVFFHNIIFKTMVILSEKKNIKRTLS